MLVLLIISGCGKGKIYDYEIEELIEECYGLSEVAYIYIGVWGTEAQCKDGRRVTFFEKGF